MGKPSSLEFEWFLNFLDQYKAIGGDEKRAVV